MRPRFEPAPGSPPSGPRLGRLQTAHGTLETPAFLPVATYGAIRGLAPGELLGAGVQGLLANTYHLHLRPGEDVVERLGGLHRFMAWPAPLLTDSGGYQLFSLNHLVERSEGGVRFRSPIDGDECQLTPESCIAVQEKLGADLIVTLDEFEPVRSPSDAASAQREREHMERTLRWAKRGRDAQRREDQLLFGIVQGGGSEDLRRESAERTRELGFEAFAIGGLGLGEPPEHRARLLAAALEPLPGSSPRYLMGLGHPEDLIAGVENGVDLFDCVVPTRHGRHGSVFTRDGGLNLRNARFRDDPQPVGADCRCVVCRHHSRAYLRHLIVSEEALGARLASLHNLHFYSVLLDEMRRAIAVGRFVSWKSSWLSRYRREASGGARSGGSRAATHSAA
ncbi:MAG: tRNA guanosine(34) transglycosylase Tgt [Myxococcota bacterium]